MRMPDLRFSLTATVLVLLCVPAAGHHSSAMFDDQSEITLTGEVTRFDYLNPHSWLYMNVTEDDGTVTEWGFELSAPPLLRRAGVSAEYVRPGIWFECVPIPSRTAAGGCCAASSRLAAAGIGTPKVSNRLPPNRRGTLRDIIRGSLLAPARRPAWHRSNGDLDC